MVQSVTGTLAPGLHPARLVPDFVGFVQPHSLSRGRLIFLVVLVVFFCLLFIASYIWMRRPSFGQGGDGRPGSTAVETKGAEKEV
jgi:hypothetical protein